MQNAPGKFVHTPMRLSRPLTAAVAAVLIGGAVIGAVPALTQVSIGEALAGGVVVRGRVADVFGDRFLIEDASGRVLVEAPPAAGNPAVETGQNVVVEGRLRGRVIEASRVTTADTAAAVLPPPADGPPPPPGARIGDPGIAPPPPPPGDRLIASLSRPVDPATVRTTLEGIGFKPAGSPVRHEKDTEIPVRDSQGRAWVAWLDRFGRASEIEIVDYDDDKVPEKPAFSPTDLPNMIAKEGFQARAQAERRPEHFEILATNQRSELVELHVDFAGQIYKQVWVR